MPRRLATDGIILPALILYLHLRYIFIVTILSLYISSPRGSLESFWFCGWVLEVVLPWFALTTKTNPSQPTCPTDINILWIYLWISCLVICILTCEGTGWHKSLLFYSAGTPAHWPCPCSFLLRHICKFLGIGAPSFADLSHRLESTIRTAHWDSQVTK
jgi:hypothetical protein